MGHDDDYDDDDYDDYGHDDHGESGGGMSTGMTVLIVLAVVGVLFCFGTAVIAAIAIPNLIEARKHGNEAAAIGGLKTISNAQTLFREGDGDRNDTCDYGDLSALGQVGYVDAVLAGGMKQGYVFEAEPGKDKEFTWWAKASPVQPGTTGDRFFYTDHTGVIYFSTQDFSVPPADLTKPPPGLSALGR